MPRLCASSLFVLKVGDFTQFSVFCTNYFIKQAEMVLQARISLCNHRDHEKSSGFETEAAESFLQSRCFHLLQLWERRVTWRLSSQWQRRRTDMLTSSPAAVTYCPLQTWDQWTVSLSACRGRCVTPLQWCHLSQQLRARHWNHLLVTSAAGEHDTAGPPIQRSELQVHCG